MASIIKHTQRPQAGMLSKLRSYNEVVAFLDACRPITYDDATVSRMRALDVALDHLAGALDTVVVGGTNGKSSTLNFAARLLKKEGYATGVLYSSHLLTYLERIVIGGESVSQKQFTEAVSTVISACELNKIDATVHEILTMSALLLSKTSNVDVVLLEVGLGGRLDATVVVNPKIAAVTRVAY